MGDSHYRSNLKGKVGTETISNFAGISAADYIMVGTGKYLFGKPSTNVGETSASILAYCTTIVATSKKGSLYMGDETWSFDSDTTATKLV